MSLAMLINDTTVDESDLAITDTGEGMIVRDDEESPLAFIDEIHEQIHHGGAGGGVEVPGRFVCKDDRGIVDKRAGDRDALLLTTRHFTGKVCGSLTKADAFE